MARVRSFIEGMIATYSTAATPKLIGNLRTRDEQFYSACFELLLHQVLLTAGRSIEVEPQIGGKNPDFRVTSTDGTSWVLEATCVHGDHIGRQPKQEIVDQLLDYLDEHVDTPGFQWWTSIELSSHETPRAKHVARELNKRASEMDYGRLRSEFEASNASMKSRVVRVKDERSGWTLAFEPYPVARHLADGSLSTTFIDPGRSGMAGLRHSLQARIASKLKQVRRATEPIMLAIGASSPFAGADDIIEALYGSETVTVTLRNGAPVSESPGRASDGFWTKSGACGHIRLDYVAFMRGQVPWNLDQAIDVYECPGTECRIDFSGLPFRIHRVDDGRLVAEDAPTVREHLGLPTGWPLDTAEAERFKSGSRRLAERLRASTRDSSNLPEAQIE